MDPDAVCSFDRSSPESLHVLLQDQEAQYNLLLSLQTELLSFIKDGGHQENGILLIYTYMTLFHLNTLSHLYILLNGNFQAPAQVL